MGKSTINGTFSIAMLVYQRVATDSHSEPQMSLLEYTSESPFGQLKFPNHIRINWHLIFWTLAELGVFIHWNKQIHVWFSYNFSICGWVKNYYCHIWGSPYVIHLFSTENRGFLPKNAQKLSARQVFFVLLRDRTASNWLLAHPAVVPLNRDGGKSEGSNGRELGTGNWDTPVMNSFAQLVQNKWLYLMYFNSYCGVLW